MQALSKILLPVDFSERSVGAARYANILAKHFHSEVTLLHVMPLPQGDAGPPGPAATPAVAGQVRPSDIPAWPRQFAQVIVEILAGSRPPRQIVPWTTDRVRARIDLLSQVLASDQRPRIRRIMTSRPAARVVEMTVVVSFGPRSRALAMRFEHMPPRQPGPGLPVRPARWLCTEIETG